MNELTHYSVKGQTWDVGYDRKALIIVDPQVSYLEHHGIKGQKWGLRRYQNMDGSLTALGARRLGYAVDSVKSGVTGAAKATFNVGKKAAGATVGAVKAANNWRIKKKKEKISQSREKVLANKKLFTSEELRELSERFAIEDEIRMDGVRNGAEMAKTIAGAIGSAGKALGEVGNAYTAVTGETVLETAKEKLKRKDKEADLKYKKKMDKISIEQAELELEDARRELQSKWGEKDKKSDTQKSETKNSEETAPKAAEQPKSQPQAESKASEEPAPKKPKGLSQSEYQKKKQDAKDQLDKREDDRMKDLYAKQAEQAINLNKQAVGDANYHREMAKSFVQKKAADVKAKAAEKIKDLNPVKKVTETLSEKNKEEVLKQARKNWTEDYETAVKWYGKEKADEMRRRTKRQLLLNLGYRGDALEREMKHDAYIEGNALIIVNSSYLEHHGVKGQKWGVRRYQNKDGSRTALGRKRLGYAAKNAKSGITGAVKKTYAVGKYTAVRLKSGVNSVFTAGKKAAAATKNKAQELKENRIERKKFKASQSRAGVMKHKKLFTTEELIQLSNRFNVEDQITLDGVANGATIVGNIADNAKKVAEAVRTGGLAYKALTGDTLIEGRKEKRDNVVAAANEAKDKAENELKKRTEIMKDKLKFNEQATAAKMKEATDKMDEAEKKAKSVNAREADVNKREEAANKKEQDYNTRFSELNAKERKIDESFDRRERDISRKNQEADDYLRRATAMMEAVDRRAEELETENAGRQIAVRELSERLAQSEVQNQKYQDEIKNSKSKSKRKK